MFTQEKMNYILLITDRDYYDGEGIILEDVNNNLEKDKKYMIVTYSTCGTRHGGIFPYSAETKLVDEYTFSAVVDVMKDFGCYRDNLYTQETISYSNLIVIYDEHYRLILRTIEVLDTGAVLE